MAGLRQFVRDVEFMLDIKLSVYWKITWAVFIPCALFGIFVYSLVDFPTFESNGYEYPPALVAVGWAIAALGLVQVPLWAAYKVLAKRGGRPVCLVINIATSLCNQTHLKVFAGNQAKLPAVRFVGTERSSRALGVAPFEFQIASGSGIASSW